MKWFKHGLVCQPDRSDAQKSHCTLPTPIVLDDRVRVFFGAMDAQGISSISWVDFDRLRPWEIISRSMTPVLSKGERGYFDENGVVPCSVVRGELGELSLYYVGFELGTKIRYRLLTGLCKGRVDSECYERLSKMPILERSEKEPYFRCGPCVKPTESGAMRMVYIAGGDWEIVSGKELPIYEVVEMLSEDGRKWGAYGEKVLTIDKSKDEHGFGRPWLQSIDGEEYLFYSVRRKSLGDYRSGIAKWSSAKNAWERMDESLGLGCDEEPLMYMATIELDGNIWAYYNGANFGKEGILLARLESL